MLGRLLVLVATIFCLSTYVAAKTDKVVCYYSSWSLWRSGHGKYQPQDIDTSVCTHVIYAFMGADWNTAELRSDWENLDAVNDAVKLKNPKVKTLIAVGGWNEGSVKYSNIVANPTLRANFVKSALNLVLQRKYDGLDLDWEYPAKRGGAPVDKQNFVALIKELRETFDPHGLLLSAAVYSVPTGVDISYDVPALTKYLDMVNIMAYDIHGDFDGVLGHNAPLYPSSIDVTFAAKEMNIKAIVDGWLARGADPQKLVLGLATYGRSFTLADTSRTAVGGPSRGAGNPGPHTQQGGVLAYYEIVLLQQSGGWNVAWDEEQAVPYMYKGDQWISYDDPRSIALKTELALSNNLGGVMIWSVEQDDFNGLSNAKYPLLAAIKSTLDLDSDSIEDPDNTSDSEEEEEEEEDKQAPELVKSTPEPIVVTTKKISVTSTRKPNPLCSRVGVIRDTDDCSKFHECVSFGKQLILYTKQCAAGLAYNYNCACCDYPENVPDCS